MKQSNRDLAREVLRTSEYFNDKVQEDHDFRYKAWTWLPRKPSSAPLGQLTIERMPTTLVYMILTSTSNSDLPRRARRGTSQATIVPLADQAGETETDIEQITGTRMPFSGSDFTGFAQLDSATMDADTDSASHVLWEKAPTIMTTPLLRHTTTTPSPTTPLQTTSANNPPLPRGSSYYNEDDILDDYDSAATIR